MKIEHTQNKDKKKAIEKSLTIAKELKRWFTKDGLKNMKYDLEYNNLITANEKGELVGFLCWNSENGIVKIVWLAVKNNHQGGNIGSSLLKSLEKKAKKMGALALDVETLTDKNSYEPYKRTRHFYYKNGFKKLYEKKARAKGWNDEILMSKKLT